MPTPKPIPPREARPLWKLRALTSLAALVLALASFEVACRVIDVDFNPNPNWRFHEALGWTQEISKQYDYEVEGRTVRVSFNAAGFRDVEHALAKSVGTKRLVVIGDSFSEAIQVNLDETYWTLLGARMSEQGTPWEVINLGVGDFGTAQALLALQEFGMAYAPDFVLVQSFALNDICNNTLEHAGLCKSTNDDYRPYFVSDGPGIRPAWTQPFRHWLRSNLITFGVLEKAYLTWVAGASNENATAAEAREAAPHPLLGVYSPPSQQHPAISRGWEITESLLREIDKICRQQGIPWALVLPPFEARVTPSGWKSFSQGYPGLVMVRDYPETRFAALLHKLDAPFIPLLTAFENNADTVLPFIGGHLSPAGHAIAATEIFAHLEKRGLVGTASAPPAPTD